MASARPSSLRPLFQNLLLALSTMVVVGATAEGLARLFEGRRPAPLPVADYITRWRLGEDEFYTIKSAATGWPPWEDYNSEGVRDREHAVAKPPGVRRLVCLGDSVTLGTGLSAEEAYPRLLEDRLEALGQRAEVLNVALGGWATRQERVAYERIARKYQPDVVLLGLCLNDIPELQNNLSGPPRLVGSLYRRSALVRWAVGAREREIHSIEDLFEHPEAPRVREAFRRLFSEIELLQRAVQADGARLAVMVFPFRGQMGAGAPPPTVQEEIASFCRQRAIPFLDLRPALRELGGEAFSDHVHLTALGSERVADAIADSGLVSGGEPTRPPTQSTRADSAAGGAPRPDVHALLATLGAPEAERRAAAARAVGNAELDPAECVPALNRALADPSPQVRSAAAWALGDYEAAAAPALPRLVAQLADPEATVRAGAAWAIGRTGSAARGSPARALVPLLNDPDERVRRRAGDALVRVGADESCLAPLIETVGASDADGRAAAAWALGGLGPAARPALASLVGALGDPRPDVRGRAAWALGHIGPGAHDAVGPLLTLVPDPVAGLAAIDALGAIGSAAAVPGLGRALHDPNGGVRWRAAQALGQMGTSARAAAADLVAALDDPEANVRLAAARAVVRVEVDPNLILPALRRAMSDADSRVRVAAIQGLGHLGPRAGSHQLVLMASARDPDPLVRSAAAKALWHVGPSPEARALLATLAENDPDDGVRAEARRRHSQARAER